MQLLALELRDFRNIQAASFAPDPGLTVIAGANGQGKTNLLEAVYLLCGGKSFRGSKDNELVRHGCPTAGVLGRCLGSQRELAVRLDIYGPGEGKRGRFAQVNGVDYGRATAIAGQFTAVVFEPGHLSLVKAGPDGRRRFLDAAICQLYPGYIAILRRYNKALTQKNALLRQYNEVRDAAALLDVFDAELAASGSEVSRRRTEWLAQAGPAAEGFYAELSSGAESLQIHYEGCCGSEALAQRLAASRQRDLRAGFCTCGPHREDFDVLLNGQSARTFGSQGQQRSTVLALKLAEAAVARTVTGEHPVLLLDDVLSELDEGRQSYLLARMDGKQSIVTCCDAALFRAAGGKVVRMEKGCLVE